MRDKDFQEKINEISKLKLALKEKDTLLAEYQEQLKSTHKIVDEVAQQLALELKIANQIHDTLMPTQLPLIANCEFSFKFHPANFSGTHTMLGKDSYEILAYGKKGFSVLMSSCETSAMSSLLLSAKLKMPRTFEGKIFKNTLKSFLFALKKEMLQAQNGDLNQRTLPLSSVLKKMDLICIFVNQKTYELFYYLTGNIKAFVYFSKFDELKEFQSSESLFDDEDENKINVGQDNLFSISLNQKDRIIICSPGILACQNPYREPFSLSHIEQIIVANKNQSIHQLRHQVFFELDKFCQGRPFLRDQSLLVFEVKNNILKLATTP